MEITSIDCAKLLQNIAWVFYKRILNKTQIHKILFFAYGLYLAKYDKVLFTDDTPKAWPFGPVFPRVNREIDISNNLNIFSENKKEAFLSNNKIIECLKEAMSKMYDKSALDLTRWSHKSGSPWYNTIYEEKDGDIIQHQWNTEIPREEIRRYFLNEQNI